MATSVPTGTGAFAAEYVRHGFSLCAIPRGTKGPSAPGWNRPENAITDPAVAALLTEGVGLLHAYSRTMALDYDDIPQAKEWLLARGVNTGQLIASPDHVEIDSGRENRGKLLYRLPEGIPPVRTLQIKNAAGDMILEFRCADGGGNSVQDVLPPSIHPDNGQPYRWGGPGDWRKLPVIPAALLKVWTDELAKGPAKKSEANAPMPHQFPAQSFGPRFEPVADTPENRAELARLLRVTVDGKRVFNPDAGRADWLPDLWSIAAVGPWAHDAAWDWSKEGRTFDPQQFEQDWKSFDPSRAGGITAASFFARLRASGVQDNFVRGVASPAGVPPVSPAPPLAPGVPSVPVAAGASVHVPVDWSQHGDVRNARYLARTFGSRLLYIHGHGKWLRWSAGHWVLCDQGQEIEAAKTAVQAMLADAAASHAVDPDRGKARVKDAVAAHNLTRLRAALELAQSEPNMSARPADLDADPELIGVDNGVVNLRSGVLITNRPDLLITRHCAADYDLTPCSRWLQFMAEVFAGDQATVDAVQRLLGYTLTGLNTEEIIVFCIGSGANGKSIFGNIVSRIAGGYSRVAPHSLLAARRSDDNSARGDIAMLEGARLVSVNELPGGMYLDEQTVKALAGREPISARHLYGEFFTFDPRFTVWVRTNHKPIIRGDDDGIWRRVVVLPFRQKFEGTQRDPHLETKLWAERNGILRWMIEGARRYLASGSLALSPAIVSERQQYRSESDLLGEFLTDCTVADPSGRTPDTLLFDKWTGWCGGNGLKPGTKTAFTRRLGERGFLISRSNGSRFYSGLRALP
ncbi:phage/plasmid primase, P4 family [Novosphingobium album (ex Liu et al. 2023)]|uniref:Phage/plasmid primase, P4 family n=1 Tax=Novosphingobium album (ex Liu et al. 2023) TaxID=3031130 RepID=A0ABT5WNI4_9SPHN|nr:phage/plasmid primase, P4 family [Novosphingobium album (ex Liu et al. 2023)]MDE8651434.1 phage/plasmid primase, P4 family [Novosphingobium album (ex Liu et al. 2023)]